MDQEYNLIYKSNNSDILAKTNVVIRALMLLGQVVDRLLPKLAAMFRDSGKAASSAAPKVDKLAASLDRMSKEAIKAGSAMATLGPASVSSSQGVRSLSGSLVGSLSSGLNVVHRLVAVMRDLGHSIQETRRFSQELGNENLKILDQMREISFLRGNNTPDAKATADVLAFGMKTGGSTAETVNFLESFEGAIPAARQRGNVTPVVEKGLAEQGALFAARTGLDQETGGKLAGLLGEYSKIDSVEVGAGQLGMIGDQLNLGVGKLRQLAKPFLGLAGSMVDETGGRVHSLPELAAIYGAMTTRAKSASVAATQVKQVNRLVTKTGDENKKLLAKAGITDDDDYVTAVRKVSTLIAGADGDKILKEAGFENSTERDSSIAAARAVAVTLPRVESVGYGKTAAERHQIQEAAGRQTIEANREFVKRDETGRFARAKLAAARFSKGEETRSLEAMRTEALAELIAEDQIKTPSSEVWDKIHGGFGFKEIFGAKSQELTRIDKRVARNITARAKAAGINVAAKYPAIGKAQDEYSTASEKEFGLSVRQLRQEILDKGRSPTGDSASIGRALDRAGAEAPVSRMGTLFPVAGDRPIARPTGILPGLGWLDEIASPVGRDVILNRQAAKGAAGGAGGDPAVVRELQKQTDELQKLNAKVGAGAAPARPPIGPLRSDVDDSGNARK